MDKASGLAHRALWRYGVGFVCPGVLLQGVFGSSCGSVVAPRYQVPFAGMCSSTCVGSGRHGSLQLSAVSEPFWAALVTLDVVFLFFFDLLHYFSFFFFLLTFAQVLLLGSQRMKTNFALLM